MEDYEFFNDFRDMRNLEWALNNCRAPARIKNVYGRLARAGKILSPAKLQIYSIKIVPEFRQKCARAECVMRGRIKIGVIG